MLIVLISLVLYGGEGGIRTPDSLATMSDFESGAFNRALPTLRTFSISWQAILSPPWRQSKIRIHLPDTCPDQLSQAASIAWTAARFIFGTP